MVTPHILVGGFFLLIAGLTTNFPDLLESMDGRAAELDPSGCERDDSWHQDNCNSAWIECHKGRRGSDGIPEGGSSGVGTTNACLNRSIMDSNA